MADAAQVEPYLRHLRPGDRVLDIGCGDGALLRLLRAREVPADGIDLNSELVGLCRADGLAVTEADAREAVRAAAGGHTVFSMLDFVEHVPMDTLREVLAAVAARPGARLWLQTPNLDSVMGFKFWFHMPSHVLPLHPWVLRKMLTGSGFRILAEWTDYGGIPWTGFRRWLTMKILNGLFGPPLAQMFVGGGNICFVAEVAGETADPPATDGPHGR